MIYAIDYDGVLVPSAAWPEGGDPNPEVVAWCKIAQTLGNVLILWTCRSGEPLENALRACREKGLEFDYVNENTPEMIKAFGFDCRKVFANFYIDDRALLFEHGWSINALERGALQGKTPEGLLVEEPKP